MTYEQFTMGHEIIYSLIFGIGLGVPLWISSHFFVSYFYQKYQWNNGRCRSCHHPYKHSKDFSHVWYCTNPECKKRPSIGLYWQFKSHCPKCRKIVDWNVCWCGVQMERHYANCDHTPVPIGCDCLRLSAERVNEILRQKIDEKSEA